MLKKMLFVVIVISACLMLNSCQKTADEHYNNAMEFVKVKNFNLAIIELDKAIEIDPNFAKAYLERGRLRFNQQFFEAVIKSNPDDSLKLESLFESSIKDFNEVLELDTSLVKDALVARGNAYLALKKYNKAILDFEEVLKKDSTNKQITWIAIHCKSLQKDTIGTELLLNRIISINPYDAENYYYRAVHRLTMFNDNIGACDDLNRANKFLNVNEKYLTNNLKEEINKLIKINCTR